MTRRSARTPTAGTAAALAYGAGLLTGRRLARKHLRELRAENDRLRREAARWEWRAEHDPLTGLLNRAGLHRYLDERNNPLDTLVLIDLDQFKPLNDAHGHRAGDALLVALAERLDRAAATRGGLAARLGGDEFVLALPPATASDVESILDTLTATTCLTAGNLTLDIRPALSAGLARRTGPSWTETLHHADLALYAAKRDKHQRLAIHTPNTRPTEATPATQRLRESHRR